MENKKVDKKKSKFGLVILIIFLIILLFCGGYFIYKKIYIEDSSNNENNNNDNNNSGNNSENDYSIKIYKTDTNDFCFKYDENNCKDLVFIIKTETNNSKVLYQTKKYILYDDNGLKLYNSNNNEIIKINLENTYDTYEFMTHDDEIIGIIYGNNNENESYYDLTTKTKKFENKYQNLDILDENYLSGYNINIVNNQKALYLLNIKDEKEEIKLNVKNNPYMRFFLYKYNDKYFYVAGGDDCDDSYEYIYDNNKKLIYHNEDFVTSTSTYNSFNEDKIYIYKNNNKNIEVYDMLGNLIKTSNTYDNVMKVMNNYVVYVNNDYLTITNINNESETKQIVKWDESYSYDTWLFSGYYTREKLDMNGYYDNNPGFYISIYFQDKDSKGNYGITYYFSKIDEITSFPITIPRGGRCKPVLYLYPTITTNIKVSFEHPEYLTTTYPKYYNSWVVKANPNGDLYDKNNKYYYALYWDEIRYHEVNFKEGFYVTKENAINFLEEKLSIIGLNDREKNEFIMYWLPILENNKQSLVYFELTEERESTNKLIIEPKPDSLLRVSIHIKKVNERVNIKEQKLNTFERNGFVAVEWGGMTY